jgi:MftR C-terminal domain
MATPVPFGRHPPRCQPERPGGDDERPVRIRQRLAECLAGALRQRGVTEPAASLTAEAGIAVFRVAFERWVSEAGQADLPRCIRESLDELKAVTAGK